MIRQTLQRAKILVQMGTFYFQPSDLWLIFLSSLMSKNINTPIARNIIKAPGQIWARMKPWSQFFYFLFFIFYLAACGLDIEDSSPPSAPQWVEKSYPEEWPERGIDAHESGGIFLEWLSNPSGEDVQNYLIFRTEYFDAQDSLGDFSLLFSFEAETANVNIYTDRTGTANIRYYYVLIAEDASGNQSTPSDTLSYMRFAAINSASMLPNGLSVALAVDRKLEWSYRYTVAMENYTITILSADNGLILRRELTPSNYIGDTEYFTMPDTIVLSPGNIYTWRVDMGGHFSDGRETAGSESSWATFLYRGP